MKTTFFFVLIYLGISMGISAQEKPRYATVDFTQKSEPVKLNVYEYGLAGADIVLSGEDEIRGIDIDEQHGPYDEANCYVVEVKPVYNHPRFQAKVDKRIVRIEADLGVESTECGITLKVRSTKATQNKVLKVNFYLEGT